MDGKAINIITFFLLFTGFVSGIAADAMWTVPSYWITYGLSVWLVRLSLCYFTNKHLYMPPTINLPPNEEYKLSRAFVGYISPLVALLLLAGWLKHHF